MVIDKAAASWGVGGVREGVQREGVVRRARGVVFEEGESREGRVVGGVERGVEERVGGDEVERAHGREGCISTVLEGEAVC